MSIKHMILWSVRRLTPIVATLGAMSLAIASNACMMAGEDEVGESLGTSQEALLSATAEWHQGQAPIDMGPATDRYCYLTGVTGNFQGSGERVHVRIEAGRWQVFGTSSQTGVSAKARCKLGVAAANIGPEFTWNQGQAQVNMGSANNRACYLTYMSGKFGGSGEGIWVTRSNGTYFLGGQSQQSGVMARGRCLLGASALADTVLQIGNETKSKSMGVQAFTENNGWACGLTRMQGAFKGNGEYTFIDWNTVERILVASSRQGGLLVQGSCF